MNYTQMTFQVPEGYEDQIKQLVLTKIEGILSTIILSPMQEQKDEFDNAMSEIFIQNN